MTGVMMSIVIVSAPVVQLSASLKSRMERLFRYYSSRKAEELNRILASRDAGSFSAGFLYESVTAQFNAALERLASAVAGDVEDLAWALELEGQVVRNDGTRLASA